MATALPHRPVGYLLPILAAGALMGCAGRRTTVGDGFLQKRQYLPGWHWGLGKHDHGRSGSERSTIEPMTIRGAGPELVAEVEGPVPVAYTASESALPTSSGEPHSAAVTLTSPEVLPTTPVLTRPENSLRPTEEPNERHLNPWAIPAFAVALGTVTYAILGTSAVIVVAAVILTIILAAIAVRKGRMNEWSGKGFAVTALVVGCLSALITVIALLNGGG